MSNPKIHPPYVWFGGKRKVAPLVWRELGDVSNYIEPFFGGGSVWLLRPHEPKIETINDYDGFVANFWRAVKAEPDAVADAIDWPVNEIDLEARHRWLCKMPAKEQFLDRMKIDPDFYSVKRAAWWVWGLNAWIGSGWCGGEYWPNEPGKSKGRGVCDSANKLPHLGRSVHRQLPHLGSAGQGVHRQRPDPGNRGVHRPSAAIRDWMQAISDRLRRVRVCCGDWSRICTDGATSYSKTVGVFLDPPYSGEAGRDNNLYRCEDLTISDRVRQWCIDRTDQDRFRIVLAGYEGEHDELETLGWRVEAWKTQGGFASFGKNNEQGRANTARERLWYSPSCLGDGQNTLFEESK